MAGKWTGLVSTATVTHASPAPTYAHASDRNWEADSDLPDDAVGVCKDIAAQLLDNHLNDQIRVLNLYESLHGIDSDKQKI